MNMGKISSCFLLHYDEIYYWEISKRGKTLLAYYSVYVRCDECDLLNKYFLLPPFMWLLEFLKQSFAQSNSNLLMLVSNCCVICWENNWNRVNVTENEQQNFFPSQKKELVARASSSRWIFALFSRCRRQINLCPSIIIKTWQYHENKKDCCLRLEWKIKFK